MKRSYGFISTIEPALEANPEAAREALADSIQKEMDRLLFGCTESTAAAEGLTWEKLQEAMKPVVYYADIDYANRGEIVKVAAANGYPEFFIVHPDDLEAVKKELSPQYRLVHLREWRGLIGPTTKPFSPFTRQRWFV